MRSIMMAIGTRIFEPLMLESLGWRRRSEWPPTGIRTKYQWRDPVSDKLLPRHVAMSVAICRLKKGGA